MENITNAIIAVMTEVNGVEKSMTVGTGSNSYQGVSDTDVKTLLRASMIKNGLAIVPISNTPKIQVDRWEEDTQYGARSKQSVFTEVETKYLLLHTSGESIEVSGYGQGVDTQDKGAGKATTYALKNTLLNMFLIPTGVDTESTHSDEYATPKVKTEPKDVYTMTVKDVEEWNGKIYGSSVYIQNEKKTISQDQIAKLKAHPKYIELPPK